MIYGEDNSCHNDIVSIFHEFTDETSLKNALSHLSPRNINETSETTAIVGVPENTDIEQFICLLENVAGIIIAEKSSRSILNALKPKPRHGGVISFQE